MSSPNRFDRGRRTSPSSTENADTANRRLYREKFATVLPVLREVLDVDAPEASFYLWPKVPDDERFARQLFERKHVTVLPGSYIARETAHGNPGRGRVRISLVATVAECIEAAARIHDFCAESG